MKNRILLFTALLVFCNSLFAQEPAVEDKTPQESQVQAVSDAEDDVLFSISVGAEAKITAFTITDTVTGHELATLNGTGVSPAVRITTGDILDNPRNKIRIFFEAGYSDFSTDKQTVEDEEKDLGTSIDGKYYYLMPMIYYSEVEKGGNFSDSSGLVFGIGLGIGSLKAEGTAVYYKINPTQKNQIDVDGTGPMLRAYIGYQTGNLEFYLNAFSLIVKNDAAVNDDNEYTLTELAAGANYKLYF